MFTGIVEELGEVVAIVPGEESSRITVRVPYFRPGLSELRGWTSVSYTSPAPLSDSM